jgi:hypothetical integral membrane protein (TIGR02206 family)
LARALERGVGMLLVVTSLPFLPWGLAHIGALVCTVLAVLRMVWVSRREGSRAVRWQRGLAVVLLAEWPLNALAYAGSSELSLQNGLPLHLCDVAAMAAVVGLLWRWRLAAEMAYFFGLTGTLQGLLTPSLAYGFPHLRFFTFFLTHGAVVVAAVTLVVGMGLVPRAWAVLRMLAWLLVYGAVVGLINKLLGTNYGFLCAKPPVASALDFLGAWPWYIAGIVGGAGTMFGLLDLPFAWRRWRGAAPGK